MSKRKILIILFAVIVGAVIIAGINRINKPNVIHQHKENYERSGKTGWKEKINKSYIVNMKL